jgi:hypothetical protein
MKNQCCPKQFRKAKFRLNKFCLFCLLPVGIYPRFWNVAIPATIAAMDPWPAQDGLPLPSAEATPCPSFQRLNTPTQHKRFRRIFRVPLDRWCDRRMEKKVPEDKPTYGIQIIPCLVLCRESECGYGRYVRPGCTPELRVPFSRKNRFCPSYGKVRIDDWVNDITRDYLEVPHLHITQCPPTTTCGPFSTTTADC